MPGVEVGGSSPTQPSHLGLGRPHTVIDKLFVPRRRLRVLQHKNRQAQNMSPMVPRFWENLSHAHTAAIKELTHKRSVPSSSYLVGYSATSRLARVHVHSSCKLRCLNIGPLLNKPSFSSIRHVLLIKCPVSNASSKLHVATRKPRSSA
jgi:hypothetical protein